MIFPTNDSRFATLCLLSCSAFSISDTKELYAPDYHDRTWLLSLTEEKSEVSWNWITCLWGLMFIVTEPGSKTTLKTRVCVRGIFRLVYLRWKDMLWMCLKQFYGMSLLTTRKDENDLSTSFHHSFLTGHATWLGDSHSCHSDLCTMMACPLKLLTKLIPLL